MTDGAPKPLPIVLVVQSRKSGWRYLTLPRGVASLAVSSLSDAATFPADVAVLDADDPISRLELRSQPLGGPSSLPVIAVGNCCSNGAAAVEGGADDWVRSGDDGALIDRLQIAHARRGRRQGVVTPVGDESLGPELERAQDESLRALGLLLECRDLETKGHTDRVVALGDRLARHLGLEELDRRALRHGAYLHDIGKVALPDRILFKEGPLEPDEWVLVREHADIGFNLAARLNFLSDDSRSLVRHHHERWNGGGYPHGLTGEEIPLLARIFGLVDVFDALLSRRPYKPAWSPARALEAVRCEAGRSFDPRIAAGFLDLMESRAAFSN